MKPLRTIAVRLFLLIALVQVLILSAFTWGAVRLQEAQLMRSAGTSALRISDLIARSTRSSMLLNRKEDVHNIIMSIGTEPGIEGIRIYNKQGEVIFAKRPEEIRTRADMSAEACVTCHTGGGLAIPTPRSSELSRTFTKPGGERVLGLITPIPSGPECSDAACHAHPPEKTILGVLDVKITLAEADRAVAAGTRDLLLMSGGAVLLISLVSGGFIWLVIRRPVQRLDLGMARFAAGDLAHRIEERGGDELANLARAFNRMGEDLRRARDENLAWSATLEDKVREKTADLEHAHRQMMRAEKLVSLGNLSATVAHELNNPLEGILTYAKLLIRRLRKSRLPGEDLKTYTDELTLIADEAARCGTIVRDLLVFARQSGGSFETVRLSDVLHRCELLMRPHARMHNVNLTISSPGDLCMEADPHQLQQALVALTVNAVEAMRGTEQRPAGGDLAVSAGLSEQGTEVLLRVSDTGVGMTEQVKSQIFEPFFTTKSEVRGVGLGLAVVYGIVRQHHGSINVDSVPGGGTTFTLRLPVRRPAAPAQGAIASLEGSKQ
jgi:two-component system NtrC family sensor kinase